MLEFYTGPYRNLIAKRIYCCKFNESTLGSVSTEAIGYVQRNVGAKRISINLVLHFPLPPPSLLKISTVLQGWDCTATFLGQVDDRSIPIFDLITFGMVKNSLCY